jgi:tape measure domain-containing protein
MADDLTIVARLRDELTGPLRRVRREVADTARVVRSLGRTGAERNLVGAGSAASKFGDKLHSLDRRLRTFSTSLTTHVASGLRTVGTLLAGATAAGGFFAVKTAANMEVAMAGIEALTGSAAAAADLFDYLKSLDPKAPFDIGQLAQAAVFLGNSGVAADKLRSDLQGIVDVAALAPDRFDDISRAVAQIRGSGSLLAQDLNQLVQAGAPVEKALQKAFGISTAEFRNRGDGVSFSSDEFLTALFGIRAGTAEKIATDTFTGLLSSVRSRVMLTLSDSGQDLLTTLKKSLPDLEGTLGRVLAAVVAPLTKIAGVALPLLVRGLDAAAPILGTVATGFEKLVNAAAPALAGLDGVGTELNASVGRFFDALVPVMPDLVDFFGAMVGLLPAWIDLLTALVPVLSPVLRVLTGLLGLTPVRGLLVGIFTAMMAYKAVAGVVGGIVSFANALNLLTAAKLGAAGVPLAPGVAGPVLAGGGGLGAIGKGLGIAGGLGMVGMSTVDAANNGTSWGNVAGAAAGGALAGATVGSIFPVIGTGLGAAAGGIIGGGASLIGGMFHDSSPTPAAQAGTMVDASVNLPPGAIVVYDPASDIDLQHAITDGITGYQQERTERGVNGAWGG